MQADARAFLVDREGPGSTKRSRLSAGPAEPGRDAARIGKAASGTAGGHDSRQARETCLTEGPRERTVERLSAHETGRGEDEGAEPFEGASEDADRAPRQGMDQVGAGRMVGSGVAAAVRCSASVFQRRHWAQRSLHSELRHSQERQT